MKKVLFIVVLFSFMSLSALAQKTGFEKLNGMENVEYINIDKSTLEQMYQATKTDTNANANNSDGEVEELTLITIDKCNKKAVRRAHSILKKNTSKEYSKIINIKDKEDIENVNIYYKNLEDNNKIYIIHYEDDEDMILSIVKGSIGIKEAKSMVKVEIK